MGKQPGCSSFSMLIERCRMGAFQHREFDTFPLFCGTTAETQQDPAFGGEIHSCVSQHYLWEASHFLGLCRHECPKSIHGSVQPEPWKKLLACVWEEARPMPRLLWHWLVLP